jgi:hypothetical protein
LPEILKEFESIQSIVFDYWSQSFASFIDLFSQFLHLGDETIENVTQQQKDSLDFFSTQKILQDTQMNFIRKSA